ncbi:MAG: hypothetical protein WC483_04815, partial [Candidatus Paceibacterota bacterium]
SLGRTDTKCLQKNNHCKFCLIVIVYFEYMSRILSRTNFAVACYDDKLFKLPLSMCAQNDA